MSSSDHVLKTLRWARSQGFRPVPLRRQSKAPIDEKYVEAAYVPPPDDLWLKQDFGVGVVTGPRHSGPVDVDIDCDEAAFFAQRFLPPSGAVFGRPSKPDSHYLYKVSADALPKKAFIDPVARSTIVEIRADGGHQTVFPGSLHEATGELIAWSKEEEPVVSRVETKDLEFAVRKVAIATLVVRHMWAEGQRNEVCKHLSGMLYYLEWSEDDVKSLVSAIMDFTGDDDKTRLRTVGITYKKGEKGGKITGSNTLSKFMGDGRVVERILEWGGSALMAFLQDYNERFAVVTIEGKFRIAETAALERGGMPTIFGKFDFMDMMATDTMDVEDDKGVIKKVPKAKLWLANPRRRTYRAIDFVPGVEDTSPILNLWTGWGTEPSKEGSCQAWMDLLYYTICGADDALFDWMLHWFANIVREPKAKPMTAPVICGRQGAGKSLLLHYFGQILGPAYITVTNEEHIYGRFNKHLATALLLHSEEALYGGDRKHRGIIKSLITDEYRIFEQKGIDARRVHNYLRLALTSNEMWAAPTEVDDRRFTVIDLEGRKVEPERLAQVLAELKSGGPAALFNYLLRMKYDDRVPRRNVKNEALSWMKQVNFEPIVGWWYERLMEGQLLPGCLAWAGRPDGEDWPEVVGSTALYTGMLLELRKHNMRYTPNATVFALQLNKMLGKKLVRIQKYFSNPMTDDLPREVKLLSSKQYAICDLPPLDQCRASFAEFTNQKIAWPKAAEKIEQAAHERF